MLFADLTKLIFGGHKADKEFHRFYRGLLTSKEAAILNSYRDDEESLLYELAVSTLLTPNEVQDTLKKLEEKNLIEEDKSVPQATRLTSLGKTARMAFANHQATVIYQ